MSCVLTHGERTDARQSMEMKIIMNTRKGDSNENQEKKRERVKGDRQNQVISF